MPAARCVQRKVSEMTPLERLKQEHGIETNWNGHRWEAWFATRPREEIRFSDMEAEAVHLLLKDGKKSMSPVKDG